VRKCGTGDFEKSGLAADFLLQVTCYKFRTNYGVTLILRITDDFNNLFNLGWWCISKIFILMKEKGTSSSWNESKKSVFGEA
jgi:hypothetical protein